MLNSALRENFSQANLDWICDSAISFHPGDLHKYYAISQNLSFHQTVQVYQDNPVYTADIGGKRVTHIMLKEEAVYAQYLAEDFRTQIIFISRHSSQRYTYFVYTPGNLSCKDWWITLRSFHFSAKAMQAALQTMNRLTQQMQLAYHVSYECTHHGPSLRCQQCLPN